MLPKTSTWHLCLAVFVLTVGVTYLIGACQGTAGNLANLDLIYVCSKHGVEYVRTYEGGITESVDKDGGPIECQP